METTAMQTALKRAHETQGPVATAVQAFVLDGRSYQPGETVEAPFEQLVALMRAGKLKIFSVGGPCAI